MLARKEYTYSYEEGRLSRAAECDITLGANETVTGKTVVNTVFYIYDGEGTLIRKRMISGTRGQKVLFPLRSLNNHH